MAGEGTAYTIDIDVPASSATDAAAAVDTLAARLTQAQAAATAAADAVKAGEAAYRQAETSADRAAKALEKINIQMQSASGAKLEQLKERQADAAKAAEKAAAAVKGEAAALDKLKAASSAADGLAKTAQAMKDQADAAKGNGNLGKLAGALGQLGGPLGSVGQKAVGFVDTLEDMAETAGAAGPYAALAVAVAAVATAVLSATVATAAWAVSLADAARSDGLLAAGIAGSVEGGKALNAQFGDIERRIPVARSELEGMAKKLRAAGLEGKALGDALEDAASKAAEEKFGPEWQKEMSSLSRSADRLKRGVAGIFGGLKIDKLLDALASCVDLFDENNAAGKAIKTVFEDLFQPIIDGAAAIVPKVRSAFIQLEILALKALIAIKPYGWVFEAVGIAIGVVAGLIVGVLAVAIGIIIATTAASVAVFAGMVLTIKAVGGAIVDFVKGAVAYLQNTSLSQIGTDLINGLVNGIMSAGPAVLNALGGVVTGAIDSAKHLLGIASPSKVFAEIGSFTGEGMAVGVEDSTAGVQGALEAMVTPPAVDASASSPAGSTGSSGGGAVYQFYITGSASDADAIRGKVEEIVLGLLEGDVAQIGMAVTHA